MICCMSLSLRILDRSVWDVLIGIVTRLSSYLRLMAELVVLTQEAQRTNKKLLYFCSAQPTLKTNAATLVGIYQVLFLDRNSHQAYSPLKSFEPYVPFHDASAYMCTFSLTVLDCIQGMEKAKNVGFIDWHKSDSKFNVDEWDFYEQVEHGDMNWIVPNKFLAFSGPMQRRVEMAGFKSLIPEDYWKYFQQQKITGIIRLNKKVYDRQKFLDAGFNHYELYFPDGSCPPDKILARFLDMADNEPGALAVHCKAGLGRTGTLICCWMMLNYKFTAEEAIGYIRICRPGSVIGPQQHFLKEMQMPLWKQATQQQENPVKVQESRPSTGGLSPILEDVQEENGNSLATSPVKNLRSGTHATPHPNLHVVRPSTSKKSSESQGYQSPFGMTSSLNVKQSTPLGKRPQTQQATSQNRINLLSNNDAQQRSPYNSLRVDAVKGGTTQDSGSYKRLLSSAPSSMFVGGSNGSKRSISPASLRTTAPNGQPRKLPNFTSQQGNRSGWIPSVEPMASLSITPLARNQYKKKNNQLTKQQKVDELLSRRLSKDQPRKSLD